MTRRVLRAVLAVVVLASITSLVLLVSETAGGAGPGTSPLSGGNVSMVSTPADGMALPSGMAAGSTDSVSISDDGSAVAFTSTIPADKLVTDPSQSGVTDSNAAPDVFIFWHPLPSPAPAITTLVSVDSTKHAANGTSGFPQMAPFGVGLVFESNATNLVSQTVSSHQRHLYAWVPGLSAVTGVFLVDTKASGSAASDTISGRASISLFPTPTVVFDSTGSDLVNLGQGHSTHGDQVYAHNLITGNNTMVSKDVNGDGAVGGASEAMIAGYAPEVVFIAEGDDLVAGFDGHGANVFVHNMLTGNNALVSVKNGAASGSEGTSGNHNPVINRFGTAVTWQGNEADISTIPYQVPGDHIYYRTVLPVMSQTQLVDVRATGDKACNNTSHHAGLSGDGTVVVFDSECSDVVNQALNGLTDTNGTTDVFARTMFIEPTPRLVSINDAGTGTGAGASQLCGPSTNGSFPQPCVGTGIQSETNPNVTVNLDGTAVAFYSTATDVAVVPHPPTPGGNNPFHPFDNGNVIIGYPTKIIGPPAPGYHSTFNATVSLAGENPDGTSGSAVISQDGGTVAYVSYASNLVTGDTDDIGDAFVTDIKNSYTIDPLTEVDEGDPGDDNTVTLTINRQGPNGTADSVKYETADGLLPGIPGLPDEVKNAAAAMAPGDYTADSGTLSFPPGVSTRTVTFHIKPDKVEEGLEAFHVSISGDKGAFKTLLPGPLSQGNVIINDDDGPAQDWHVDVSTQPPVTAVVGDHVQAKYTVTVDPGAASLSVGSVDSGAATKGLDPSFPTPPATVAAGSTSAAATATATVVAVPGTAGVQLEVDVTGTLGAGSAEHRTATTNHVAVTAAVSAAFTGAPGTTAPGAAFTYTYTLTNGSDTDVELTGGAGFMPPSGTTATNAATTTATLSAHTSVPWTLPVTVDATDTDGQVLTATPPATQYAMSAIGLANQAVVAPTAQKTKVAAPAITTSKHKLVDENGGTLEPGDVVDISVTVTNSGTGTPTSATLTDALANLSSVSDLKLAGASCSPDCTSTGSSVTVPLGALAKGASKVVTFKATVAAVSAGTDVTSSVTVDFAPATTGTSPTTANVKTATTGSAVPLQDWRIVYTTAPPASAVVGDTVTVKYTVQVDPGDDDLVVSSVDDHDAGLDSISLGAAPTTVAAGTTSAPVTSTARVVSTPGTAGIHLQLTATGVLGSGPSAQRSTVDAPISSTEAVTMTLAGGTPSVALPDSITYTLHLTNAAQSPVQLSGIVAGLGTPPGTTGGPATGATTLAGGASTDWKLTVAVDDADTDTQVINESASASYAMSAVGLAARPVAAPAPVSSTVAAPVVTTSAHTLKDVDHGTLNAGDVVAVAITITNHGTGAATSASLGDVLTNLTGATGFAFDGTACGGCAVNASTLTAPIPGGLPAGGSTVLTFSAKVASVASGSPVGSAAHVTFAPATVGSSPTSVDSASTSVGQVTDTAPAATDDAYSTPEDTPLTVAVGNGVLKNDTDADGDVFKAVLVSQADAHGTVALADDGSFTYSPAPNFHGTATFTYQGDDSLKAGNIATVTITVTSVPDAPVTLDGTQVTVAAGGTAAIDLSKLASDGDGDMLTFAIVTKPAHGDLVCTAAGACSYKPSAGFSGNDSFQFTASDGAQSQAAGKARSAGRARAAAVSAATTVKITVTAAAAVTTTTTASSGTTATTTSGTGSTGSTTSSGSGTSSGGTLPRTGAQPLALVVLAALLIGVGALLVAADRRLLAGPLRSRPVHPRCRP